MVVLVMRSCWPQILLLLCVPALPAQELIEEVFCHASESSAVICFRLADPARIATSRVAYGAADDLAETTAETTQPGWLQFHRITGLEPGRRYAFQPVVIDPASGEEERGPRARFRTATRGRAVPIAGGPVESVRVLDRADTSYVLTDDLTAPGTAFEIRASGVTLDLDGHRVTFGVESDQQVCGVLVGNEGPAVVCNGTIVQGDAAGKYSSAIDSRWRAAPIEVFGVDTDVHRPCSYPMRVFGRAADVHVHHNRFASRVTEIESRHYPGNDLLRIDGVAGPVDVHDNLLLGGCHVGIRLSGAAGVDVHHNEIRHHARYVNGYALAIGASAAHVHDNVVRSTGRGAHLIAADIDFADNLLELRGHMTLDDMPQGSRPWRERRVELHGIKLEGRQVRGCVVRGNRVELEQPASDADYDYVPVTPLNVSCYAPDARAEIMHNTFIARTAHRDTHHGPYGRAGQWAAALCFVGMNGGQAPEGGFAAWIHDNTFISNDLFVAGGARGMTLRIERNRFVLAQDIAPTRGRKPFRGIDDDLRASILGGGNVFDPPLRR